jgi:hypothetical protein
MTKPLRLGLIGCGFFAINHLHARVEKLDIRIAAVCDPDASKVAAAAKRFSAAAPSRQSPGPSRRTAFLRPNRMLSIASGAASCLRRTVPAIGKLMHSWMPRMNRRARKTLSPLGRREGLTGPRRGSRSREGREMACHGAMPLYKSAL